MAKDNLQLIGAAALLLASKVEELMPPLVSDFVYVCDDAYTRDTILAMERKMLKVPKAFGKHCARSFVNYSKLATAGQRLCVCV